MAPESNPRPPSVADFHIAAAAAARGAALIVDAAALPDRPATARVANDLAPASTGGCARLGQAGPGQRLRPFPNRTLGTRRPIILFAGRDRLPGAAFLAFIVVVEDRALGAGDLRTAVAVDPETVL